MHQTDAYTNGWQRGGTVKRLQLDDGSDIRYLDIGTGPTLILIHSLRTQLDYFQKLIPLLQAHYHIYAVDLPGSGYSQLAPTSTPDEPFFRGALSEFITQLELRGITLVGESIGGVLALTLAAALPKRVSRVVSLNPYDHADAFGGSIRRSKSGWIIGLFRIFRGYTIEARPLLKLVFSGSVAEQANFPHDLFLEFDRVGRQKGYRKTEYGMYKAWRSWLAAPQLYHKVHCPVTIMYGEQDWSLPAERDAVHRLLPKAHFLRLPHVGHFSALEAPERIAQEIHKETTQ